MKIRMRNPEFPLYFIGELGFGIFLFLDSPYKVISLKEKCIMILICVTIWNIVFMISRMRIIIMDKNGCTVKLLLWKKTYKWEDLEIIRRSPFSLQSHPQWEIRCLSHHPQPCMG